jgi:serine/threonine protein kinase/Tol biopolymer transport system component
VSTPDRWQDVERLYHEALARDAGERVAFLHHACAGDDALRGEVESLLAYETGAQAFMQAPVIEAVAPALLQSEAMTAPLSGHRLGPYEIGSLLGSGGMGDVYRARDTKLGRDVAIKILPDAFAMDADRRARFEREARLLATLNHPHIGAIYGFEERSGIHGLVLELVEGETLAQRLSAGAGSIPESLIIARQVAEALEAAHEKGIVHRDLKPANIAITPAGAVKVLDFGLAKTGADASAGDLTQSPTVTVGGTRDGVILGTAAYMSPEQARGKHVDKQTDIWAFGCVVYEMLAGRKAFAGDTVSDTLAAILERAPDWSALPPTAPSTIGRLLQRCLEKDPKRRLHDIADARIEIDEALASAASQAALAPSQPERRAGSGVKGVLRWTMVVVALAVVATLFKLLGAAPPDQPAERRVEISTPPSTDLSSFAVSPDGSRLVFVATWDGRPHLWLRRMESTAAQPIALTAGAQRPCWSSKGDSIAFFADAKLKYVDVEGGSPHVLADSPDGECTWNEDGEIVYAVGGGLPLHRVSYRGGSSVAVTSIGPSERVQHHQPSLLPDGHHFFLQIAGPRTSRGAYIGSLGSPETRRLFDADAGSVVLAPPDQVLYVQGGTLFARHFDVSRLEAAGTAVPVARQAGPRISVSSDGGVIAYRSVPERVENRELAWVDRSGKLLASVEAYSNHPELSPDGRVIATWGRIGGTWILDTTRRAPRRLNDRNGQPIWSPDGSRLVFNCSNTVLCVQRVDGTSPVDTLWTAPSSVGALLALDWSRDGRFLLFKQYVSESTSWDVYALPMTPDARTDGEPIALVASNYDERDAQFSPDAKWIAYQSNETGRFEIWLRSFPDRAKVIRVTENGGTQVRWPRAGTELFYLAPNGTLMTAPLMPASNGKTVEIGSPVALFPTNLLIYPSAGNFRQDYDVSHDGSRILMNVPMRDTFMPPITVILNWRRPSPSSSEH